MQISFGWRRSVYAVRMSDETRQTRNIWYFNSSISLILVGSLVVLVLIVIAGMKICHGAHFVIDLLYVLSPNCVRALVCRAVQRKLAPLAREGSRAVLSLIPRRLDAPWA